MQTRQGRASGIYTIGHIYLHCNTNELLNELLVDLQPSSERSALLFRGQRLASRARERVCSCEWELGVEDAGCVRLGQVRGRLSGMRLGGLGGDTLYGLAVVHHAVGEQQAQGERLLPLERGERSNRGECRESG